MVDYIVILSVMVWYQYYLCMYDAITCLYLVRNPITKQKYVSACLVWWIISSFIALSGISVIISAVERIEHESWIIEQVPGMLLGLREF